MSNHPRSLLFVQPRHQSLAIGQFCSSPQAPKGRWGLRAFKRRASTHSSFCVACEHFADSRQCVYFWRTRVYIVARDDRAATDWRAFPARLTRVNRRDRSGSRDRRRTFWSPSIAVAFSRSFISLGSVELCRLWVGWIILTAVFLKARDEIVKNSRVLWSIEISCEDVEEKAQIYYILLF